MIKIWPSKEQANPRQRKQRESGLPGRSEVSCLGRMVGKS